MRASLLVMLLLVACVASGPRTMQDKLQHMHACQRIGGIWYTSADTPEYEGRCDWTPKRSGF